MSEASRVHTKPLQGQNYLPRLLRLHNLRGPSIEKLALGDWSYDPVKDWYAPGSLRLPGAINNVSTEQIYYSSLYIKLFIVILHLNVMQCLLNGANLHQS